MPGTISIPAGATSTLYCATSSQAAKKSGAYFAPFGKEDRRAERWIEDRGVVGALWEESERMVGEAGVGV